MGKKIGVEGGGVSVSNRYKGISRLVVGGGEIGGVKVLSYGNSWWYYWEE